MRRREPQSPTALLTFSIGPVHTFIAQARKVADLWSGSQLLSHLTEQALGIVSKRQDCTLVHPYVPEGGKPPETLTNRFTCRVPASEAEALAKDMASAVETKWQELVKKTVRHLEKHYQLQKQYGHELSKAIWDGTRPTDGQAANIIETSWSWIEEEGSYGHSASLGVAFSKRSRLYRPFRQVEEVGDKCAVCGERTALPDGHRGKVRNFWLNAAEIADTRKGGKDIPFLRDGQTRLCLVCTTKRFFPKWHRSTNEDAKATLFAQFKPFESFATRDDRRYFALVAMDGDRMGQILEWGEDRVGQGRVETFRQELSRQLTDFADGLIGDKPAGLKFSTSNGFQLTDESVRPQLIFAGGEDVRFVCHAQDALPLAKQVQEKYRQLFRELSKKYLNETDGRRITISAGILYAHVKHAAGLLFNDVTTVLDETAKRAAGRNAIALRLDKRSGAPVEVAFKWDEPPEQDEQIPWLKPFEELVAALRGADLSSSSSFDLRLDEQTLSELFTTGEDWNRWLGQALRQDGLNEEKAKKLATLLTPFFVHKRTDALRIARFLGREINQ